MDTQLIKILNIIFNICDNMTDLDNYLQLFFMKLIKS